MLKRFIALCALLAMLAPALAQEEEAPSGADRFETRRTPTMREAVYKRLSEAQELAEAEDLAGAQKAIGELMKMDDLNSYERAQMHNFQAFIAFSRDDYEGAIRAYEQVLAQPDLPKALGTSTLYSLAQLNLAEEHYAKAVDYLKQWFAVVDTPKAEAYFQLGQAYLLLEQHENALEPIRKAIAMKRQAGEEIAENWYLALRSALFELGRMQEVVDVQETLVRMNPKKQYWVELSSFYGEIGDQEKQLYALEVPWREGKLEREAEYLNLGQMLMQAEIPYRGAKVISEGLEKGIVERNERNLRLVSQAWMLAQEFDRAVKPLEAAAERSDDGELYDQLASSLFNLQRYEESEEAAVKALEKGDLRRRDQTLITLGMARYNQDDLDGAIEAFKQAQQDSRSASTASKWLAFIRKEKERLAQLDAL